MKKIADNSSFMTYHLVCIKSNTSGVTSGAGTAYPSGARHGTTPQVFNGVRVAQYVVFCVVFYRSLFVLLVIAVSPSSIDGF